MNPAIPVFAVFVATACVLAATMLLLRDLLFRCAGRKAESRVRIDRLRAGATRSANRSDSRPATSAGLGFARLIAESGLDISRSQGSCWSYSLLPSAVAPHWWRWPTLWPDGLVFCRVRRWRLSV